MDIIVIAAFVVFLIFNKIKRIILIYWNLQIFEGIYYIKLLFLTDTNKN